MSDELQRYVDQFGDLAGGELVEIDPQNPADLAAFRDVAEAQKQSLIGGDE